MSGLDHFTLRTLLRPGQKLYPFRLLLLKARLLFLSDSKTKNDNSKDNPSNKNAHQKSQMGKCTHPLVRVLSRQAFFKTRLIPSKMRGHYSKYDDDDDDDDDDVCSKLFLSQAQKNFRSLLSVGP